MDTAAWPIPALVDHVLATYVEWRQTTDAVADTYGRWCVAPAVEEAARFAAYLAALDQEQTAAGVYAESISELERRLWTRTRLGALSLARRPADGGLDQRLREEGDSRPSSRARLTASARLCTPSLAYTLRRCVRIVFSDTNSSAAISGARRLVGR